MQQLRDLIVVIPGITGSVLRKKDVDIWAPSLGALRRAYFEGTLESLKLHEGSPEEDSRDGIEATGLIKVPRILAGLAKTECYEPLRRMIAENFRVVPVSPSRPGGNYLEFPYDWRRKNKESAVLLQNRIQSTLDAWRRYSGNDEARAILIAHSMGGLVARYYVEAMEGWRDCRAQITLGTPHRGAPQALKFLSNGSSWPLKWLVEVGQTFPSIHELLPVYEMHEQGGALVRVAETNLPGIDGRMATEALQFHREIEAAASRNRQNAAYLDQFRTIPVVGTNQVTQQSSCIVNGRLVVSEKLPLGIDPLYGHGDGTVPRLSATPIEMSSDMRENFLTERHSMLQANPHILDSLRELLRHLQAVGLPAIRGPIITANEFASAAFSLHIEDVYSAAEPVIVRATLRDADTKSASLEGVVTAVDPSGTIVKGCFSNSGQEKVWAVGNVQEGLYRIEVTRYDRGGHAPTSVCDIFEVTACQNLEP